MNDYQDKLQRHENWVKENTENLTLEDLENEIKRRKTELYVKELEEYRVKLKAKYGV